MADFVQAVEKVLTHEGGYTSGLPNDPGGETNFGISKRAYPDLDIKNLTREGAIEIYKRDYWKDWMESQIDQATANCYLDAAVNQGGGKAFRLYELSPSLRAFQLARLLAYTSLNKPQFYKSWFSRVLDV